MSVPIPPDYDAADIRALTVRKIEDTAFALARNDFGRQPTLTALRAAVARLIGIAITLRLEGTREDLVERVQNVIDLSNDDAIELYGEPEGE
jgi:hypothetical protein